MGVRSRKVAVAGKPRGQKTAESGRAKLQEAADRTLGENSVGIAQKLLDKMMEGNVTSARLLWELAETQDETESGKKKRRSPSQARSLAAEPKWEDEVAETAAEGD
jgi:hypothetical protein